MIVISSLGATVAALSASQTERMITHAPRSHILTNVNVWSPDGEWIVYDSRSSRGFDGKRIEQVHVRTGEVQLLYQAKNGAHCGVVTYNPAEPKIVFILGPEHPTADWSYGFTRRRGVLVDARRPGAARPLDAMNYAPPFQPGALRGGSHVHVFSHDGRFVSFTYEDEVLAQLDADPGAPPHEPNQRNIGVTAVNMPVVVPSTHPRSHAGDGFSVLVTRTVAHPRPGTDDISRAVEEGWVGEEGYLRADGVRQRALAFQGLVTAADGRTHTEVFIVDLPSDLTRSGERVLQGTPTTRPAPPAGAVQRRLTFTADRRHPGVAAAPRHWMRSSPDGEAIAFLMRDDSGILQFWTVSPRGGAPRQLTRNAHDIASAFTWSPGGDRIAHVMDGSVCETDVATGATHRLTARDFTTATPSPLACVYSPCGDAIAYMRRIERVNQIFVVASGSAPRNRPREQSANSSLKWSPMSVTARFLKDASVQGDGGRARYCMKRHSQKGRQSRYSNRRYKKCFASLHHVHHLPPKVRSAPKGNLMIVSKPLPIDQEETLCHAITRMDFRENLTERRNAMGSLERTFGVMKVWVYSLVYSYGVMRSQFHIAAELTLPNLGAQMKWMQISLIRRYNRARESDQT